MKTILLVIILTLLFLGCRKDRENDPVQVKNTHRIRQIIYDYVDVYDRKIDFSYNGEKLVSIIECSKDLDGNWIEIHKREISYSGNNIISTWFYKKSENWVIGDKSEYTILNGLMIEENNYNYVNGKWVEDWKYTYNYAVNDLIAWQSFSDEDGNGTIELTGKGEYLYQEGNLIEYKGYATSGTDKFYQNDEVTFSYTVDNLISYIDQFLNPYGNWQNDYKCTYIYSGDNVSGVEYSYWNSDLNQWEVSDSESFIYNSGGYLVENSFSNGDKVTYEYEEGHGNAKFFWYYPEKLVYGMPMLKNSEKKRVLLKIF